MSELIRKVLTGVLRVIMAPILTWLISQNIISSDESVKLIAEIFAYLIPISWSVWAWIKAQREKHTALAMPKNSTPKELKDQMATGRTAAAIMNVDSTPKIASVLVLALALFSLSACASTDQFNKVAANLTKEAIVVTETNRCTEHAAPCLTPSQFKAANAVMVKISDAGITYTKLRLAGKASPADALIFFRVISAQTTILSRDFPSGTLGTALQKLVELEARLSKFIQ